TTGSVAQEDREESQGFRSARCCPAPHATDLGEEIPLRYGIRRERFSEQEVGKTPGRIPECSEAHPGLPWRPQRYRRARNAQPRNLGCAGGRKSQAAARPRVRRRLGIRTGGGTDREAHQGGCGGSCRFQSRQTILEMMQIIRAPEQTAGVQRFGGFAELERV